MKFKIGDKVRKVSGYRFDGVVIAAFKNTVGQVRYSVQVDATEARKRVEEVFTLNKELGLQMTDLMNEMSVLVSNCDGMIHIFSEDQLATRE